MSKFLRGRPRRNLILQDVCCQVTHGDILHFLDRGLDDMEEKRELPVDEAFEMITKLRIERRNV